jgi:hypothetical protein|tara:strand:+ start:134 stop:310 length:177 start_codon:yes stop_codon:yes gene_type:complete
MFTCQIADLNKYFFFNSHRTSLRPPGELWISKIQEEMKVQIRKYFFKSKGKLTLNPKN